MFKLVIDVKLPTKEDLMIVDEVVFPEAELNTNNVISQAQITIPGSIILSQLEKEGMAVLHMFLTYTLFGYSMHELHYQKFRRISNLAIPCEK